MTKSAAHVLAGTLDMHGVDVAYCVPGESYLPLTDALIDFPNMQLVVCRHEGALDSWRRHMRGFATSLVSALSAGDRAP